MPFVAGTPESLEASLQRRDSRDFSSTCRGINQNGTPCKTKISAKVSALKTTIDGKEAYFCWRHKEQASALIQKKSKVWDGSKGRRGSMDFLVEKVVAMAVTDEVTPGGSTATATAAVTTVKVSKVKPSTPQGGAYPFPPVPIVYDAPPVIPSLPPASSHKHKVVSFLNNLFNRISTHSKRRNPNLFPDEDSEDEPDEPAAAAAVAITPAAPAPQYQYQYQQQPDSLPSLTSLLKRKLLSKVRFDTSPQGPPLPHMVPEALPPRPPPSALSPPRKPKTQMPGYMSRRKLATLIAQSKTAVIPPHLTSATQKRLHETLSKPFSASDTPGYIYIFALLPSSPNRPNLPTDPSTPPSAPPRVLLKIGRTVNVASRLNQHANQCNYEPTLIRYYPHPDPKSPAAAPAGGVHKVPNVNRIERLIHLELRDDPRVYPDELRHTCAVCGKTHKEWFSVEASEEGVRWVDGVIARWIAWGEYWGGGGEGARRTAEEEAAKVRRGEKIARSEQLGEDGEGESSSGEEVQIVVTGKARMESTPPRAARKVAKDKDTLTPGKTRDTLTPALSPGKPRARTPSRTPRGAAATAAKPPLAATPPRPRPSPPRRAAGHRSTPTTTPTTKSKSKSKSKSPRKTEEEEEEEGESDASYHDAESGEVETDEGGEEGEEGEGEEGEEGEVWVDGGKVGTGSPVWRGRGRGGKRGVKGGEREEGGMKKVKAGGVGRVGRG